MPPVKVSFSWIVIPSCLPAQEEDRPTLCTSPTPPMLYDYYGFPPESYELSYPAPGPAQPLVQVSGAGEWYGFEWCG